MRNAIHERVRKDMRKGNVSQTKICAALSLSPAYVSDVLNGKRYWTPEMVNGVAGVMQWSAVKTKRMMREAARAAGWPI